MRIKLGFVLGAFALAALGFVPSATAQRHQPDWVWVCHNGHVLLVNVNSAHIDHGDEWAPHPPYEPPLGFCQ